MRSHHWHTGAYTFGTFEEARAHLVRHLVAGVTYTITHCTDEACTADLGGAA